MSPSGPPLEVTIRSAGGERVLGRGVVPGGYPDIATAPALVAKVPVVRGNQQIEVCLKNVGRRRVAVFGAAGEASPRSSAHNDRGAHFAGDMTLEV